MINSIWIWWIKYSLLCWDIYNVIYIDQFHDLPIISFFKPLKGSPKYKSGIFLCKKNFLSYLNSLKFRNTNDWQSCKMPGNPREHNTLSTTASNQAENFWSEMILTLLKFQIWSRKMSKRTDWKLQLFFVFITIVETLRELH